MASHNGDQGLSASSVMEDVPVAKMRINREAQATYSSPRAATIAAEFDPDAFGKLLCNYIEADDVYHVVDGQHRLGALRIMGWDKDQKVECEVYKNLSPAEEAYLFRKRNEHRRPAAIDSFLVALTEGDPVAQAISAAVSKAGFVIGKNSRASGTIQGVQALYFLYDLGGGSKGGPILIAAVLKVLNDAFGGGRESLSTNVVKGTGMVLQRYGTKINLNKLVDKLSHLPNGAHSLIVQANVNQAKFGRSKLVGTAAAIVDAYNTGRGSAGKIESWWK